MPLYKVTEKRLQKRAREDEDGTTRLKAALREMGEGSASGSDGGWSDVSSDDDDDDDDDNDEDEDVDDDSDEGVSDADDSEEEQGASDGKGEESEDDDEEIASEGSDQQMLSDDESEDFPITIESALSNPIYDSDDLRLCVLCPGKIMKNEHMVKSHLDSNAHKRAAKRYHARLSLADTNPIETSDPRELVEEILADLEEGVAAPAPGASAEGNSAGVAQRDGENKRKRKGKGKADRKEQKAKKLIAEAEAKSDKEKGAVSVDGEAGGKLNRKARRLLEAQKKGQGSQSTQPAVAEVKQDSSEVGKRKKHKA